MLRSSRSSCSRISASTSRMDIGADHRSHDPSSGSRSSPLTSGFSWYPRRPVCTACRRKYQRSSRCCSSALTDAARSASWVTTSARAVTASSSAATTGPDSGTECAATLGSAETPECCSRVTSTPVSPRSIARSLNGVVVSPSTRSPNVAWSYPTTHSAPGRGGATIGKWSPPARPRRRAADAGRRRGPPDPAAGEPRRQPLRPLLAAEPGHGERGARRGELGCQRPQGGAVGPLGAGLLGARQRR